MATSALGILNHLQAQPHTMKVPVVQDTPNGSNDSSATDSATISANDFLTLLVTEMKNQDPTAATDPNEYINQLVQVNSLEQLISINQTLTADSAGFAPSADTTTRAPCNGVALAQNVGGSTITPRLQNGHLHPGLEVTRGSITAIHQSAIQHAPGNLSIPEANPAAQRVANALSGIHSPA